MAARRRGFPAGNLRSQNDVLSSPRSHQSSGAPFDFLIIYILRRALSKTGTVYNCSTVCILSGPFYKNRFARTVLLKRFRARR